MGYVYILNLMVLRRVLERRDLRCFNIEVKEVVLRNEFLVVVRIGEIF